MSQIQIGTVHRKYIKKLVCKFTNPSYKDPAIPPTLLVIKNQENNNYVRQKIKIYCIFVLPMQASADAH
jgi:hypothetical protein